MRDIHLRIKENMEYSLLPRVSPIQMTPSKSDSSNRSELTSHNGEHLVRSLVDRVRAHGRDEHPVQVISASFSGKPSSKLRTAKKKSKVVSKSKVKPRSKSKVAKKAKKKIRRR